MLSTVFLPYIDESPKEIIETEEEYVERKPESHYDEEVIEDLDYYDGGPIRDEALEEVTDNDDNASNVDSNPLKHYSLESQFMIWVGIAIGGLIILIISLILLSMLAKKRKKNRLYRKP